MPSVSIIVPVFNSAPFIRSCLDSLAAQTLDDIEVILVDDHGNDESIPIVKAFIRDYNGAKRFRLVSTPANGGPGKARNLGIEEATGKYLVFVDSDDGIEPEFCEELFKLAESEDADLACCDININGVVKRNADISDKKHFLRHFVAYFTTFIYRKDLLMNSNIRFPEVSCAEDTCFLTCAILSSSRAVQLHKAMYNYWLHSDSISTKKNPKRAATRIVALKRALQFAKRHGYYKEYCFELMFLFLKKGLGMAFKDVFFYIS